jgi:hypothetical protein
MAGFFLLGNFGLQRWGKVVEWFWGGPGQRRRGGQKAALQAEKNLNHYSPGVPLNRGAKIKHFSHNAY